MGDLLASKVPHMHKDFFLAKFEVPAVDLNALGLFLVEVEGIEQQSVSDRAFSRRSPSHQQKLNFIQGTRCVLFLKVIRQNVTRSRRLRAFSFEAWPKNLIS